MKDEDEILQAILLADMFDEALMPEGEQALCPVVCVPLIEFSLNILTDGGVEEVGAWDSELTVYQIFVVVGDNPRLYTRMEEYLASDPRWSFFHVDDEDLPTTELGPRVCLISGDIGTPGEALREIDSRGLINSDPFVLIGGGVVGSFSLKSTVFPARGVTLATEVIEEHNARRAHDKLCIMTSVFKEMKASHRTQSLVRDCVAVIDPSTSRLVHYDPRFETEKVCLPFQFFKEHNSLQFRSDLLDCFVDVCARDVLIHFSDNIDYQQLRSDYLHYEAQNKDMGYKYFAHILKRDYCARVSCWHTYDAVSRDILRSIASPLRMDGRAVGDTAFRRELFLEREVRLEAKECGGFSAIGRGSRVSTGCKVYSTVIGRNVLVEADCRLTGSYVWNDVKIGQGSSVEHAVLCNGVTIGRNVRVGRGVVIGAGVTIADDAVLPPFSRWMRKQWEGEVEEMERWKPGEEDDAEEYKEAVEAMPVLLSAVKAGAIGCEEGQAILTVLRSLFGPAGSVGASLDVLKAKSLLYPMRGVASAVSEECMEAEEDLMETEEQLNRRFAAGVVEILGGGSVSTKNAILELSCFQKAENRTGTQLMSAIIPALFSCCSFSDARSAVPAFHGALKKFAPVLENFAHSRIEQVSMIHGLADTVLHDFSRVLVPVFPFLLHSLHSGLPFLEKASILEWRESVLAAPEFAGELELLEGEKMAQLMRNFEQESESEEEESEGEEEEEESD